ncbi:hypothetical protein BLA29_007001 [Euroglyphus maynei]|uniref:Uncharacterized protein n=1 Tax=Euroglyphus maynei TaxID=6958 RepID=A0A1Y3B277_EURMA|nr:hypothetical protein BLA29_007001 [Euroglyphus maynei]
MPINILNIHLDHLMIIKHCYRILIYISLQILPTAENKQCRTNLHLNPIQIVYPNQKLELLLKTCPTL